MEDTNPEPDMSTNPGHEFSINWIKVVLEFICNNPDVDCIK